MSEVLVATGISKKFKDGDDDLVVLSNLELRVDEGELVAIVGRSGSGKSTMLHILAGLASADCGHVSICDHSMTEARAVDRARLRSQYMGFVYQQHHLLRDFNALENVVIPQLIRGVSRTEAEEKARAILERIGLDRRLNQLPQHLSGGERQRIAVARAIVNAPRVVLADEPTGNLDKENAENLLELIDELRSSFGTAFVLVTHDQDVAQRAERIGQLAGGSIVPNT